MAASFLRSVYCALRGSAVLAPWLLHLAAADLCLSALLPVSAFGPSLAYSLSSSIAASVWLGIQKIFTAVNGARISLSGAALPPGESAIVVANHLSWADFYMIQELALKAGMLGRCRWFAKQQLKWVPFLGWGLWAMGMPLVSRNWIRDRAEIQRVFGNVVHRRWPVCTGHSHPASGLISYSEATRYTALKHAEAAAWCKANNKPIPQHTLHPRTRGFIATVQELRKAPHVKAVYDITIAYARGAQFQAIPSFAQTLFDPGLSDQWKFHAHVERHPLDELPSTDEELAQWLEDRWVEKGRRLEKYRLALSRGVSFADAELE